MQIRFNNLIDNNLDALVVCLDESLVFTEELQDINNKLNGLLSDSIKFGVFKAEKDEIFQIFTQSNILPQLVILVGYGKIQEVNHNKIMYLGGKIVSVLNNLKLKSAYVSMGDIRTDLDDAASLIAYGASIRNYRFNNYRTKDRGEHQLSVESITISSNNPEFSKEKYDILYATVKGIYLTRDLVSEPPNVLYPESFANEILKLAEFGIEVEILDEEQMRKLGMGALLGVGQGSKREPKLAIMKYNNNSEEKNYQLALVGKGVTFDTGGISLKPALGMEAMKYDMAGAGVVTGIMKSLALRGAKVNVVGLVGLVENMPDGYAQRPSDVVSSMSGQTVEVLNTDAEGRLVLADVLWYCQDRFRPEYIVDLATLTGAITITFGSLYGGLFSNDDDLADKIFNAGSVSDEKVWRLPLGEYYDRMLNSDIADMQNISTEKGAGSITAAQFLQRFVNGTKWAHLDIAGMSWTKKDSGVTPKGATAFGLRLLDRFIKDNIENK